MTLTPRIGATEMAEDTSDKYLLFNEALRKLDALVQCSVLDRTLQDPPSGASDGDCYIIPVGGSGDWASAEGSLAYYESSAWLIIQPIDGFRAYVVPEQKYYAYVEADNDWVPVVVRGIDSVLDKDLTEAPSGPSDGDTYIVGEGTPSGDDWSGQDGNIAYYTGATWIFFGMTAGRTVWVEDEDCLYVYDGVSLTPLMYIAYDVHGWMAGVPGNDEVILRWQFARPVTFANDFTGSYAHAGVASETSGGAQLIIERVVPGTPPTSTVGYINFAESEEVGTYEGEESGTIIFQAGDILCVRNQAVADADLADITFVIKGVYTSA